MPAKLWLGKPTARFWWTAFQDKPLAFIIDFGLIFYVNQSNAPELLALGHFLFKGTYFR